MHWLPGLLLSRGAWVFTRDTLAAFLVCCGVGLSRRGMVPVSLHVVVALVGVCGQVATGCLAPWWRRAVLYLLFWFCALVAAGCLAHVGGEKNGAGLLTTFPFFELVDELFMASICCTGHYLIVMRCLSRCEEPGSALLDEL